MTKILFIGGTGTISSACSQLAVDRGLDLTLLNRKTSIRQAPPEARIIQGDIRDPAAVSSLLAGQKFDVVVDWIAYTPEQVQIDLDLFRDKMDQYVFISSASVYQKPPASLPISKSTILDNPYWEYSRNKISCEELLIQAYKKEKYPITIVRPSHTYDQNSLPISRRLVDCRPDAKRITRHHSRRWDIAMDSDPSSRFREGIRWPARKHPGHRGCLSHHVRRMADLEPDIPMDRPCSRLHLATPFTFRAISSINSIPFGVQAFWETNHTV